MRLSWISTRSQPIRVGVDAPESPRGRALRSADRAWPSRIALHLRPPGLHAPSRTKQRKGVPPTTRGGDERARRVRAVASKRSTTECAPLSLLDRLLWHARKSASRAPRRQGPRARPDEPRPRARLGLVEGRGARARRARGALAHRRRSPHVRAERRLREFFVRERQRESPPAAHVRARAHRTMARYLRARVRVRARA